MPRIHDALCGVPLTFNPLTPVVTYVYIPYHSHQYLSIYLSIYLCVYPSIY